MDKESFNVLVYERLTLIEEVLISKMEEYAVEGNVFHNFDRTALITGRNRKEVLLMYMMKHFISILDMIDSADQKDKEYIREKFGDMINYLVILETMFVNK